MARDQSIRGEWVAGWPVVFAAMFGFMVPATYVYSFGSLVGPLEAEYGWSRAEITGGLSLLTIVSAMLQPVIGISIDKWGPRRIALPGAAMVLLGFSLVTLTTGDIRVWWGLWLLFALAAVGVKPAVWTTAVASSFTKGRGFALAVALCGSGIGSTVMPVLATWLIDSHGWRNAIPMLCALVAVVVMPILYFGLNSEADRRKVAARNPATPQQPLKGMTAREVFRSVRFFKIALAGFVFTLTGMGMSSNFIPIFTSFGITRAEAAAIAGVAGISAIAGRLMTGVLLDRFNANLVGGSIMLFPILTCALLLWAPGSVSVAFLAVIIFGMTIGAEIDVIAFLTAQQFGTARYGTIFGVIAALWSLATAAGPLFVNGIYDATGEYTLALKIVIPFFVLGSLCILTLGKPRDLPVHPA